MYLMSRWNIKITISNWKPYTSNTCKWKSACSKMTRCPTPCRWSTKIPRNLSYGSIVFHIYCNICMYSILNVQSSKCHIGLWTQTGISRTKGVSKNLKYFVKNIIFTKNRKSATTPMDHWSMRGRSVKNSRLVYNEAIYMYIIEALIILLQERRSAIKERAYKAKIDAKTSAKWPQQCPITMRSWWFWGFLMYTLRYNV